MRYLYSFLYTCAFLFALPYYVVVGLLKGKYLSTFSDRLGNVKLSDGRPSIWIHAVSVGEFLACKSLIRKIQEAVPEYPVCISTTTITGQKLAREFLPGRSFYFPFDWAWAIRKVIHRIDPKLVIVMETEIWPNLLWTVQAKKIPVLLINGRISDRSIKHYSWIKKWLPAFTQSLMQTEEDARRMKSLGMPNVSTMGNLKYDFEPPPASERLIARISAWKQNFLLWVAGSTVQGEEKLILNVFARLKHRFPLKLLIAPRHPDRFSEVSGLMQESGIACALRSSTEWGDQDALILDSIGELASVYQLADIVLIGGSLLESGGGHNPIEAAYFGKAIVSGPNIANFRSVYRDFQQKNAVLITTDLESTIAGLLENKEKRFQMGKDARKIVEQNAGASEKVIQVLRQYLTKECLV
jgi:3-deoxy-D-manno-octulosonic-acid transferase